MSNSKTRHDGRNLDQLRDITFERNFTRYAEGSVLVTFGHTRVLCNASIEDSTPRFLRGTEQGWVTAEYSMLPRATHSRSSREAARGKLGGRTMEIQRLIGRSLRAIVDLKALGERSIVIYCDVLQADGGTRTASITGAYVALADAINSLIEKGELKASPLIDTVAAVSSGIFNEDPILDLDYHEDSQAEVDMNFVITGSGKFVEIQGTAEETPFSIEDMDAMRDLALSGCATLTDLQQAALDGK